MLEKCHVITLYSFTNSVSLENSMRQSVRSYSLPSYQVSVKEARDTLKLWYSDRKEVKAWQQRQKELVHEKCEVYTLLGRSRHFPNMAHALHGQKGHVNRAAINAPVQVLATDHGPVGCDALFVSSLGKFCNNVSLIHRAVQQMLPCAQCSR
jgi:hypothetical protein